MSRSPELGDILTCLRQAAVDSLGGDAQAAGSCRDVAAFFLEDLDQVARQARQIRFNIEDSHGQKSELGQSQTAGHIGNEGAKELERVILHESRMTEFYIFVKRGPGGPRDHLAAAARSG